MTTRRRHDVLLFVFPFDVVDGLADGLDLLGLVVRDLDVELLFQLHDQFDDIERVGPDVLDKGGVAGDLLFVDGRGARRRFDHMLLDGHGETLQGGRGSAREPNRGSAAAEGRRRTLACPRYGCWAATCDRTGRRRKSLTVDLKRKERTGRIAPSAER